MVRGKKTYCSSARGGRTYKRVTHHLEGINRYLMQSKEEKVDPSPPLTHPTPPEVPPIGMLFYPIFFCIIESIPFCFLSILFLLFLNGDLGRTPLVMISSTHDTQPATPISMLHLSYFILHNRKHASLFLSNLVALICR